ncbi:MAG: ferritin-like domain-containing protein [Armatimonadetes bacterium]|nr:ferritin-like domain-containing protein [Anaerolineae bacterium]
MKPVSRRNFLQGSAVAAGGTMVGFSQLFGYSRVFAQGDGDTPQTMLDLAATAETFACTHYFNAINSAEALGLTEQEVNWLKSFLDSELKHKQFLEANGAVSLATEFFVPADLFTDRALFVATSNTAENWFVAAYLSATRRFAVLGEPLLAATTAQLVGVEAEHQALIRLMGGLQPSFQTLKEPLFWNTSEVGALFQPFLEGGEGFVGPAPFPGDAEIMALVAGQEVAAVTPFIQLDGVGTLNMDNSTSAASGDAVMTGACTVMADNANVRSAPDTTAEVTGSLTMDPPVNVIGQTQGADGFTWYQIDAGWVRADAVTVGGDCAAVPMVTP